MRTFRKFALCLLAVAGITGFATAQVGQVTNINIFDASTIPEVLKKDAHSVRRKENLQIEIINSGKAVITHYKVQTVIDNKGLHRLNFGEYTDKFNQLEEVDIRVYNAAGKVISKYKKKDLSSVIAGSGLVPDGKYFYLEINETELPVTVETRTVTQQLALMNIPDYVMQYPSESVEQSEMKITYPSDMKVNYKIYNSTAKPATQSDSKSSSYSLQVAGLTARKIEDFSGPSWRSYFPYMIFNSDRFTYGSMQGNTSSWTEFGKWYYKGTSGLNQLPEKYQKEIQAMVAGTNDQREQIRILYTYLQKNFRYVLIALGVGGYIPFPASFLHEKKYGDCKGLSNYMQACLSAINIKSYQVLINAGEGEPPVDPLFPHNGFNHVILTVPLAKDTIWLECTSNYNDFGHLGTFTENRNGLIITENGGVLARTPASTLKQNKVLMNTKVALNEDGSGKISTTQITNGDEKYLQVSVSKEKEDDQKYFMVNRMGFMNPDDYTIRFSDSKLSPYMTEYSLEVEKIPDFIAGSKMFLKPRMYKFWGVKMPVNEKRTQDIYFDKPTEKSDTTSFILPEGFTVDVLPASKNFNFEYGSYASRYWFDEQNRTVYSTAQLAITEFKIPASRYQSTKAFMDKILEDENQKLIIKKL